MSADLLTFYDGHDGYCSDKWEANLIRYASLFEPFRNQPVRLLEVGVQNGGSLEIWAKYFSKARIIVGCDVDPKCSSLKFSDPRIHLVVEDVLKPGVSSRLVEQFETFDVIIDDASHQSGDIVRAFCSLFPILADEGLYIVEDLHCSYWREFQGGLFAPHSAISFFKNLCDTLGHQHWGIPADPGLVLEGPFPQGSRLPQEQLARIHSIEFANSLCIIRKKSSDHNTLGRRIVVGTQAPVDSAVLSAPKDRCAPPDQSQNEWSLPAHAPREVLARLCQMAGLPENCCIDAEYLWTQVRKDEIAALLAEIEKLKGELATSQNEIRKLQGANSSLQAEIGKLQHETSSLRIEAAHIQYDLTSVKRSWSWRLTRPLRNLWKFPGRTWRQIRWRLSRL